MKKTGAIFLCMFMLLLSARGAWAFDYAETMREQIEIMDEQIRELKESDMDEEAREFMIKQFEDAKETMLESIRDYEAQQNSGSPAGSAAPQAEVSAAVSEPEPSLPSEGSILDVAKKYYDHNSNAMQSNLIADFNSEAGAVGFDGGFNDLNRANALCDTAMLICMVEGNGDYAVACAAAAVAVAPDYARSAWTLAAILEQAGFITDGARLNDAARLAEHAISLDPADAEAYIALARVRLAQNNLDAALSAVNAALAIDPGDNVALTLKATILFRRGGLSAEAPKIGNDLKENDGELSRRATEQENAARGTAVSKDGESAEEALNKLHELYELEPITPADMVEFLFPAQAREIRGRINAVTGSQKELGWLPFPSKLINDLEAMHQGGFEQWTEWHIGQVQNSYEIQSSIRETGTKRISSGGEKTAIDYMYDYNAQVIRAACNNFGRFAGRLIVEQYYDKRRDLEKTFEQVLKEANERATAEIKAGVPMEIVNMQRNLTLNDAYKEMHQALVPGLDYIYREIRREGQLFWETMLPFARVTWDPGYFTSQLYHTVAISGIHASVSPGVSMYALYTPGISGDDLADLEAAMEEAMETEVEDPNPLEDWTQSIALGPLEFKLSPNKVEMEFVAVVAARYSYDWKAKQQEVGFGYGAKMKFGVGPATVGVERKRYVNVVCDMRNDNEVTDIYISGETKGKLGGFEIGPQASVSAMGKGASLSVAAKQTIGGFGVEHQAEIISSE